MSDFFKVVLVILLLIAGVAASCMLFYNTMTTEREESQPQPTATIAQEAQRMPLPSSTPQNTPTPAPAYEATVAALEATQAVNQAAIENAKAEQERNKADAERERSRQAQIVADAQATAKAGDVLIEYIKLTQAVEFRLGEEAQATRIAATNRTIELQNDSKRIEQDAVNVWLRVGMVAATIALIGMFIVMAWRGRERSEFVSDDEEVTSSDWDDAPYEIGGLTSTKLREIFPTPDHLQQFADAVIRYNRTSHSLLVRRLGIFTENELTATHEGMVLAGLAEWRSAERRAGIALTNSGKRLIASASSKTTAPLENTSLTGEFQPVDRQTDSLETPEGKGDTP
jgi:hypothetical protein